MAESRLMRSMPSLRRPSSRERFFLPFCAEASTSPGLDGRVFTTGSIYRRDHFYAG